MHIFPSQILIIHGNLSTFYYKINSMHAGTLQFQFWIPITKLSSHQRTNFVEEKERTKKERKKLWRREKWIRSEFWIYYVIRLSKYIFEWKITWSRNLLVVFSIDFQPFAKEFYSSCFLFFNYESFLFEYIRLVFIHLLCAFCEFVSVWHKTVMQLSS